MTADDFMARWADTGKLGWWAGNPSRVCWARAYDMSSDEAFQVCHDYLQLPAADRQTEVVRHARRVVELRLTLHVIRLG